MEQKDRPLIKVIHVHFINGRENFYFGSVSALFKKFSSSDLGVTQEYLRHKLTNDGERFLNNKVLIIRSRLLR